MIQDMLGKIDESELVCKKNKYKEKGITLHVLRRVKKEIVTLHGKPKGYFIGSGAIESDNKVVLQKRLKLAGMRWNPKTAQYNHYSCK